MTLRSWNLPSRGEAGDQLEAGLAPGLLARRDPTNGGTPERRHREHSHCSSPFVHYHVDFDPMTGDASGSLIDTPSNPVIGVCSAIAQVCN
jgi:hypothetical protein